jgi:hypothetical protein
LKRKLDRRLAKLSGGDLRERARQRDFFRWRGDKEQDEQCPNNKVPRKRVEAFRLRVKIILLAREPSLDIHV